MHSDINCLQHVGIPFISKTIRVSFRSSGALFCRARRLHVQSAALFITKVGGGDLFCNYLYCTRLGFGSNPQLQLAACLVLQSQCLAALWPWSRGSVGCGAGGREQPGPISSWLPVLLLGQCPAPAHSLFLWLSLLECLGPLQCWLGFPEVAMITVPIPILPSLEEVSSWDLERGEPD